VENLEADLSYQRGEGYLCEGYEKKEKAIDK